MDIDSRKYLFDIVCRAQIAAAVVTAASDKDDGQSLEAADRLKAYLAEIAGELADV